jgi:hypothetical protein
MLQKACEKFEFLSNNCFAKKAYFTIQALSRQFLKKLIAVEKKLSNIKLPELKLLSDISQAKSLQKCIQIADIFHRFCYINACYQNEKKNSLKKRGNFPPVQSSNILLAHTKRTKMLVQTHICYCRIKTDNWFIG